MKNVKAEVYHLLSDRMSPGTSVVLSKRWMLCAPAVHQCACVSSAYTVSSVLAEVCMSLSFFRAHSSHRLSFLLLLTVFVESTRTQSSFLPSGSCCLHLGCRSVCWEAPFELRCAKWAKFCMKDEEGITQNSRGRGPCSFLCLLSVTTQSCGLWDPFFNEISSHTPRLQVYSTSSLLNWVKHLSAWSGRVVLKALVQKKQKAQSLPTGQTN